MRQDTRSHNHLAHVVQKLSLSSLLKTATHCYLPALLGLEHFLWVPQRFGYKPWQSSSWVGILATVYATQVCTHTQRDIAQNPNVISFCCLSKTSLHKKNAQKSTSLPCQGLFEQGQLKIFLCSSLRVGKLAFQHGLCFCQSRLASSFTTTNLHLSSVISCSISVHISEFFPIILTSLLSVWTCSITQTLHLKISQAAPLTTVD